MCASLGATRLIVCSVWPKSVCDVAVPWGFARRWRKVRLRWFGAASVKSLCEPVPLGGKHAGVNACRWGAG